MTVFLPKTPFPIRSNSEATEQRLGSNWKTIDLYSLRNQETNEFENSFDFHDGPPYANGDIHIGHALNKVLKDIIIRSKFLSKHKVTFVPGWDCHGLPIEWKVEQEFRKQKKNKNDNVPEFIQECRNFAQKWVDIQSHQFQRLGILADWNNPYKTMDFEQESKIVQTFHKMVSKGLVHQEYRPVLWSAMEQTALADAETVDKEHDVETIWVLFPVVDGPLQGQFCLVWTTTPWSLPGNKALAINPSLLYSLYDIDGKQCIAIDGSVEKHFTNYTKLSPIDIDDLLSSQCSSPLYDTIVPVLPADYVTSEKGSGIVHVGPANSVDDWRLYKQHGYTDVPLFINEYGKYTDDVPIFSGKSVVKNKKHGDANEAIIEHLRNVDMLVKTVSQVMTLKHSWRSDGLLIENATPQWFIDIDSAVSKVNDTIDNINFYPKTVKNRFSAMVGGRKEWLVSRQRLWGVPMGIFVNENGDILQDDIVNQKIYDAISAKGIIAWHEQDFGVGPEWTKVTDILDVWFDSGCVQQFSESTQTATYIEGSDQTRGWFSSSALVGLCANETIPYNTIITHGFVVDKNGLKMSKSIGNVISPLDMVNKYGADVLRLWVALSNYEHDIKVSEMAFQTSRDVYSKIRNTFRYMLGALDGYKFDESHLHNTDKLDKHILKNMTNVIEGAKEQRNKFKFNDYVNALHKFCLEDLSYIYFDIKKDSLYCDKLDDPKRLAYLASLSIIFDNLVLAFSPVLVFTCEEAWKTRYPNDVSIHLFSEDKFSDVMLSEISDNDMEVSYCLDLRKKINQNVQELREQNIMKSNSEAIVYINNDADFTLLKEIAMVSSVRRDKLLGENDIRIEHISSENMQKCKRCWQYFSALNADEHCSRCEEVTQ